MLHGIWPGREATSRLEALSRLTSWTPSGTGVRRRASAGSSVRSRSCTQPLPSIATGSAGSFRTDPPHVGSRRSAGDRGDHLLSGEHDSPRVALGQAEDRAPGALEAGDGLDAHRQARGCRIDLSVARLVDHHPARSPNRVDPGKACNGTAASPVTERETRIGDAATLGIPCRDTAPRPANRSGTRIAIAGDQMASADEERDAPSPDADPLDGPCAPARQASLRTTGQQRPKVLDPRCDRPGHHDGRRESSERRGQRWSNRPVDEPAAHGSQTRDREQDDHRGKPAEGRRRRPSADPGLRSAHPHASLRTPLNLLCDR